MNSARVLEHVSHAADSLRAQSSSLFIAGESHARREDKKSFFDSFTNSQDDKKEYLLICSSPFLPSLRAVVSCSRTSSFPSFHFSLVHHSFSLSLPLAPLSLLSPPSPSSSLLLSFHNLLPPFSISFRTVSTSDPSERRREKPALITI